MGYFVIDGGVLHKQAYNSAYNLQGSFIFIGTPSSRALVLVSVVDLTHLTVASARKRLRRVPLKSKNGSCERAEGQDSSFYRVLLCFRCGEETFLGVEREGNLFVTKRLVQEAVCFVAKICFVY